MKRILCLLILALLWLVEGPAQAQYELDSNLQSGAGGRNAAVATPNFAARNNLISGLVSGGREFRSDDIDITGFDDTLGEQWRTGSLVSGSAFRGELGSDELFRFRARSLSFSQLDRFDGGSQDFQNQPVYSGVPPASITNIYGDSSDGGDAMYDVIPRGDASSNEFRTFFRTMTTALDSAGNVPLAAGVMRAQDGQMWELEATPLRGLRTTQVSESEEDADDVGRDTGTSESDTGDGDEDQQNRIGGPLIPPSIEIGTQILAAVESRDMSDIEQRAEQLEKSLLVPPPSEDEEADAESMFVNILKQIEAGGPLGLDGDADVDVDVVDGVEDLDLAAPDVEQPATVDAAAPPGDSMTPNLARIRELTDLKLDDPTEELIRQAEDARSAALRHALGISDQAELDAQDQGLALLPPQLQKLVDKLDYDLPRLASLAGNTESEVNTHFREAETHMAVGDYFKAEKAYQKVLQYKSDNELAGIGIVHAQLGAGLIRSSAANMRRFFTERPQLIATRYESKLLPSKARLQWVRGQLEKMIKRGDRTEPPLMLAYLGYQAGSPALVKYGLDLADARSPRDALLPLLRRIWLDQPDADRPKGAGRAAPAPLDEPQGPDAEAPVEVADTNVDAAETDGATDAETPDPQVNK